MLEFKQFEPDDEPQPNEKKYDTIIPVVEKKIVEFLKERTILYGYAFISSNLAINFVG